MSECESWAHMAYLDFFTWPSQRHVAGAIAQRRYTEDKRTMAWETSVCKRCAEETTKDPVKEL